MTGGVLLGAQVPTFYWAPPYETSAGQDAIDFAAACGLYLDEWQQLILRDALAETPAPPHRWIANEVGVIVGRQNGKGAIIEARELAGLFVFGEQLIMHSAHEFKTAGDAFRRMLAIVESNPDLDRRCLAVARSKGQEGFTFRVDGKRVRLLYMARTGGAGRGFTGTDTVILDEAMILDDAPIAAMLPTMATRPNWQVWYTGSAGDRRLRSGSVVQARVRARGYRREPGLMFAEWFAHLEHTKDCPPECVLDKRGDPATWAKTNPTLNIVRPDGTQGITTSFLRKMMGAMAVWDFDREHLGVGDYPSEDGWSTFNKDVWAALVDEGAVGAGAPRPYAVGLASTWDRSSSTVGVAGLRPDGLWHVEAVETRAGTQWMVDYCRALQTRPRADRPAVFVVDPKGPAGVVIGDLAAVKGLKLHQATLPEWGGWCAKLYQLVMETGGVRHLGQDGLTRSVQAVEKRELGQGLFAWERTDATGDTSPVEAVTLALGGAMLGGKKKTGRPLVGAA